MLFRSVGVDGGVLVRAVVGEDVDFNPLEATEPKHFACAELGEAAVADVVEILKRLTADVEELDTSILKARVDVDGEGALFVDNFGNLVTDLLADEHQIDKGVVSLRGMRKTAKVSVTEWVYGPVARWERVQPIDQNLSADLIWQFVDERTRPVCRSSGCCPTRRRIATEEGKMFVHTSAGNLGPDKVVGRLENHINEFWWHAIHGTQAISLGSIGGSVVTSKSCLLNESYWAEPVIEGTRDGRIRCS